MSQNLVFTETSGVVFAQFAKYTEPLMRGYAEKVGADFHYECRERKAKYPLFGKFLVHDLLDRYDRVLFLDIDILVRPDSPNLFDIVPEGSYASFNEGSWCSDGELAIRYEYIQKVAAVYGVDVSEFDMSQYYFNAGVFLADKRHKDLFVLPDDDPIMSQVTSEQNTLNIRLFAAQTKTYSLPMCFNAMPWRWSRRYVDDNYFIHHAGGDPNERLQSLYYDYKYIKSSF